MPLDAAALRTFVHDRWERAILPVLTDYIRIPAKSPMFVAEVPDHHATRARAAG